MIIDTVPEEIPTINEEIATVNIRPLVNNPIVNENNHNIGLQEGGGDMGGLADNDSMRFFTTAEKKLMCSRLKSCQRDNMLITFGNIERFTIPDLKSEREITRIRKGEVRKDGTIKVPGLNTSKTVVTYMTVVREEADKSCPFPHFHLAIKFDAKNAVCCGTVKSKLYKLYPDYHGNIDIYIGSKY